MLYIHRSQVIEVWFCPRGKWFDNGLSALFGLEFSSSICLVWCLRFGQNWSGALYLRIVVQEMVGAGTLTIWSEAPAQLCDVVYPEITFSTLAYTHT